jgi:hypothetical protein
MIPSALGAAARAAFVTNSILLALLPVNFFAICFILAIMKILFFNNGCRDDVTMNAEFSFFHCVLLFH